VNGAADIRALVSRLQAGDAVGGIAACRRALAATPADAGLLHLLGVAVRVTEGADEAVRWIGRAVRVHPGYGVAYGNLAAAQAASGDGAAALAALEQAERHAPADADGCLRLAAAALPIDAGTAERLAARVLRLVPDSVDAAFGRARALGALGRPVEAMALLSDLGRRRAVDEAVLADAMRECLMVAQRAAATADEPVAAVRYAELLRKVGRSADALAVLTQAVRRWPAASAPMAELLRLKQKLCDWDGIDALAATAAEGAERDLAAGRPAALNLNVAFALPYLPEFHLRLASAVSAAIARTVQPLAPRPAGGPAAPGGRITVGYLSGNFRDDATGHLIQGLFVRHDRTTFRVHAYSFGADDASPYRRRIAEGCDAFVEVGALSDEEAAARIRADGVDILVDVDGYFGRPRPRIPALRPAPVQVRFLDFPGSSGAPWFDYLISDAAVTPPGSEALYSERLVLLPDTYQVTDCAQSIADDAGTRGAHGLPEDGFVFCCFCSSYKIEPAVFDVWMRLLGAVPGSVLWLLGQVPEVRANLRREAAARGIAAERLVFAGFAAKPAHLARLGHADLCLDTLSCTGHTTTSDALWAGVPVLTVAGASFAARVAGSLLRAAGLPELVVDTAAGYERMARHLAHTPAELAGLRGRLAAERGSMPLFDTAGYARNLEKSYKVIWERHLNGLPPTGIVIGSIRA
jgi:predicted O-linked N-acetylglucosamine transferase (SPINDLY family)